MWPAINIINSQLYAYKLSLIKYDLDIHVFVFCKFSIVVSLQSDLRISCFRNNKAVKYWMKHIVDQKKNDGYTDLKIHEYNYQTIDELM